MSEGYDPVSVMQPSSLKKKVNALTVLLMLGAGSVGSLTSVALLGKGTVNISPFVLHVEVKPAPVGKTRLGVDPGVIPIPYTAAANTHSSPLEFVARVTGVTAQGLTLDPNRTAAIVASNPRELAGYLREHGRSEMRAFGIRVMLVSALGSLIGGLVVGFGRWKRTLFTMIAGVVVVGALGAVAGITYDVNRFQSTRPAATTGGD